MSNVVSFVEESCFTGDQFRSVRREVWFTANIYGVFKGDFTADNGLWYDYSDEYLMWFLEQLDPNVEWGFYTYHKKLDHSEIHILHPDDGRRVGAIYVRRASGSSSSSEKDDLSGEIPCGKVIPWSKVIEWKEERERSSERESESVQ